jgi:hypothetical protein
MPRPRFAPTCALLKAMPGRSDARGSASPVSCLAVDVTIELGG